MTENGQIQPKNAFRISDELKLRIISAVVLGIIVLLITWIGGQTFALLWAVIAFLILREFNRICRQSMPISINIFSYLLLALVVVAWLSGERYTAFGMYCIGMIVFSFWEYITNKTAWSPIALSYAILPFFAMSDLRSDTFEGLIIILLLFFAVWGADVFAYFTGRTFGGPKLAPRISPNKTWSGFIGSLVGALLLSWMIDWAAGFEPISVFFLIMLCVAVVSQLGDLMESALKRKFNVKDSGTSIPGHGGVLDRIDGLVVAAVFLWLVTLISYYRQDVVNDLPTVFINAFLMP